MDRLKDISIALPSTLLREDWGIPGITKAAQQKCLALYAVYRAVDVVSDDLDGQNKLKDIGAALQADERSLYRFHEVLKKKGLITTTRKKNGMLIRLSKLSDPGKYYRIPLVSLLDPTTQLSTKAVILCLSWFEMLGTLHRQFCNHGESVYAQVSFRDLKNITGFGKQLLRTTLTKLHNDNYVHVPQFSNDSKFRIEFYRHCDPSNWGQNQINQIWAHFNTFVRSQKQFQQNSNFGSDESEVQKQTKALLETDVNYLPGQVFAASLVFKKILVTKKKLVIERNTTYFLPAQKLAGGQPSTELLCLVDLKLLKAKKPTDFKNHALEGFNSNSAQTKSIHSQSNNANIGYIDELEKIQEAVEEFMKENDEGFNFLDEYCRKNKVEGINERDKEILEEVQQDKIMKWGPKHFLTYFGHCYFGKFQKFYTPLIDGKNLKLMSALCKKTPDVETPDEYKTRLRGLKTTIEFLLEHWDMVARSLRLKGPSTPSIAILYSYFNPISAYMSKGFPESGTDRDYNITHSLGVKPADNNKNTKTDIDELNDFMNS